VIISILSARNRYTQRSPTAPIPCYRQPTRRPGGQKRRSNNYGIGRLISRYRIPGLRSQGRPCWLQLLAFAVLRSLVGLYIGLREVGNLVSHPTSSSIARDSHRGYAVGFCEWGDDANESCSEDLAPGSCVGVPRWPSDGRDADEPQHRQGLYNELWPYSFETQTAVSRQTCRQVLYVGTCSG